MDGRATVQDRTFVLVLNLARFLFWSAMFWLGAQSVSAATFSISPSVIGHDYSGLISLQVGGLTNGETIRVDKFIDYNTNAIINASDTMVQSFVVTDGRSSTIGGVTNRNQPGDVNAATGAITARLNFERPDLQHFSGYQYLFRVSSPTGRFPVTNALLRITNVNYPQMVSGLVKSSGTNVPNAMAALLSGDANGRLVAGTFASTGGLFRFRPQPGTYQLVAVQKGFVTDLQNPVTFTLAASGTYSNNVQIIAGTRTISGKVVDASNTNLALRGMSLFLQSSSNRIAIAFTDASGAFNIAVTPGEWEIDPESDSAPFLGYTTPASRLTVDTSSGNVSNVVLALQPVTAMFYGTLKTPSNAPLRAVEVWADSDQLRSRGNTDSQGNFCVGVTGTNWYLNAGGDDLSLLGYLPPRGTNTTLADDQAIEVNLVAVPFAARLIGRVLDQNGAPVPLLQVAASDFTGSYSSASSGLDGRFNLGVGTGTWYMRLSDEEAQDRHLIWPELSFDITPGVNISNITFIVRSATNSIIGTVRTPENDPVPDVEVWANASIGGTNYRSFSSRTDGNGSYAVYVPDGFWWVNMNCFNLHSSYGCPDSQYAIVAGSTATVDITLLPPPGPPVLSRVRREPNGQFRFEVHGASNFRYVIEESSDLRFWNTYFSTNVYSGYFEFVTDGNQNARFYRVRREKF